MWPFNLKKKQIAQEIEKLGPIMTKDGKLIGFKTNLPFPNSYFRIQQYTTMMVPDPNTFYVFDECGKPIITGTPKEIINFLNTQTGVLKNGEQKQ